LTGQLWQRPRHLLGVAVGGVVVAILALGMSNPSASAATASPTIDPLRANHGVVVQGHTPPAISAKSWIVVDADSGDVLAAKNAHTRLRPASTLKTLTAVTLLPRLTLDDEYRVRWEDAHVTGSAVGIVPGSRYTVDQLFYGLMLPSGNDAARALASANGGLPATVREMNATAQSLGATDTHAVNPTGLDARGQLTSAFDLALFARQGLTNKNFCRYVSTTSTSFPAQEPKGNQKRKSYMIYNQNPLLINGYRGIMGVKTGYTTQAGRTFVAAAQRGGQTLIVALMGIVEPSETAAERLLQWGWTHGEAVTPVGSLDAAGGVVPAGAEPSNATHQTADPAVTATPPLANANGVSAGESHGQSIGLSVLLWVFAGAALIAAGWWLQMRRRP
jgi:D-alanyl-D-alanine carboxypeptidase (penicillin-binding protein 5/6)